MPDHGVAAALPCSVACGALCAVSSPRESVLQCIAVLQTLRERGNASQESCAASGNVRYSSLAAAEKEAGLPRGCFLLLNMCGNEGPVIFKLYLVFFSSAAAGLQELNSVGLTLRLPQCPCLASLQRPCLGSCVRAG